MKNVHSASKTNHQILPMCHRPIWDKFWLHRITDWGWFWVGTFSAVCTWNYNLKKMLIGLWRIAISCSSRIWVYNCDNVLRLSGKRIFLPWCCEHEIRHFLPFFSGVSEHATVCTFGTHRYVLCDGSVQKWSMHTFLVHLDSKALSPNLRQKNTSECRPCISVRSRWPRVEITFCSLYEHVCGL